MRVLRLDKLFFSLPKRDFASVMEKYLLPYSRFFTAYAKRWCGYKSLAELADAILARDSATLKNVEKRWNDEILTGAIQEWNEKISSNLSIPAVDFDIVTFVGAETSNAFPLMEGNKKWIGLDVCCHANIDELLIWLSHEWGHLIRYTNPQTAMGRHIAEHGVYDQWIAADKCPLYVWLLEEGFATKISEIIFPGRLRNEYLGYSEAQLKWCEENEQVLLREIIPLLLAPPGERGLLRYFWLFALEDGTPSRTGYYIGLRAAEEMQRQKCSNQMSAENILRFLASASEKDFLPLFYKFSDMRK